jgi:hypothetical protein
MGTAGQLRSRSAAAWACRRFIVRNGKKLLLSTRAVTLLIGQLLLRGDVAGRGLFMRAPLLEETSHGNLPLIYSYQFFAWVGLVTPLVEIKMGFALFL